MSVRYALKVLRKKRASLTWVMTNEADCWHASKDHPYYKELLNRLDSVDRAISILEAWKG